MLDISGNAMAAAYQTSFTIDHTVLAVVSVSPSGTVNGVVDHVDVTFNKADEHVHPQRSEHHADRPRRGRGGRARLSAERRRPIASRRDRSGPTASYQLTIGAGVQDQEGTLLAAAASRLRSPCRCPTWSSARVTPSVRLGRLRRHAERELDREQQRHGGCDGAVGR